MKQLLTPFIALFLIAGSMTSAFAAPNNSSFYNGKPFKTIDQRINELRDTVATFEEQITLNESVIEDLQAKYDVLQAGIDSGRGDIEGMQLEQEQIWSDITLLQSDLLQLENAIADMNTYENKTCTDGYAFTSFTDGSFACSPVSGGEPGSFQTLTVKNVLTLPPGYSSSITLGCPAGTARTGGTAAGNQVTVTHEFVDGNNFRVSGYNQLTSHTRWLHVSVTCGYIQ